VTEVREDRCRTPEARLHKDRPASRDRWEATAFRESRDR